MKSLLALILGVATGVVLTLGFLFYSPFSAGEPLPPISDSGRQEISLRYSAIAEDSIIFTNDGESRVHPFPVKVLQLWDPPIRQTDLLVTVLRDGRNEPAGIGVKFSSRSERTRILKGKALVDSAWYIHLPGQGSMLVEQSENHWSFIRDIVAPAHWSSGDNWRGNWHGTLTDGPGALGTGRVHGGSGRFEGLVSEAIETRSAKAYSAVIGPVVMDGQLTIELSVGTDDMAEIERAARANSQ